MFFNCFSYFSIASVAKAIVFLLAAISSVIVTNSASNFSNLVFKPPIKSAKSSISKGNSPLIILILSTCVSITCNWCNAFNLSSTETVVFFVVFAIIVALSD